MGRNRVIDSDVYRDLKTVLDNANAELESKKRQAKSFLEKLEYEIALQKARAIVSAKEAGLSDYAIGIATGRTSHKSRIALIEQARAFVEMHESNKERENENAI